MNPRLLLTVVCLLSLSALTVAQTNESAKPNATKEAVANNKAAKDP